MKGGRVRALDQNELSELRRRAKALEEQTARLQASLANERGKGEEILARHEQRYRTLFDSIDEGFCIIEFLDGPLGPLSDYVHIEANDAYARHTGIPNVVGQKVREMVPGEAEGWVELYRGVLLTGKSIRFERELVATGRFLELAAFRVEPVTQRQVAVLFQDITARKAAEVALQQLNETLEARVAAAVAERLKGQEQLRVAEEALRQAQKMEAVGQLTGGIAHDFNNMLAVIISSLRLTERRLGRGDTNVGEFITSGLRSAERAATLVSRLLAFSRQQPLSPQRTDANKLLSGMEDVLRRTIPEHIRIEFVQAGGLWQIHADPHGIESAIVNLAVNARDAMAEGGKLTIETANTHLDEAYAAAHAEVPAGQYVMIAVTDTGTGMPADTLQHVFEPFFTTKPVGAGTGLGLSQVYGFVKQSHGHVKIYSEVGVGTTVKMYFPRLAVGSATNPTAGSGTMHTAPAGQGQLVLVVEDEPSVRDAVTAVLSSLGYHVVSAVNPEHAILFMRNGLKMDLIISDVKMPGKLSVMDLIAHVQATVPDIPMIFATGYSADIVVKEGLIDGRYPVLFKPFSAEELGLKVRTALGY